jgi:hypothetical protein
MADYEVSPAYIESLLRLVKTARRIDAEPQAPSGQALQYRLVW